MSHAMKENSFCADCAELVTMNSTQISDIQTPPNVKVETVHDVINVTQWIFKQPLRMIVIYCFAYSLVFVLGLVGNGLVVWVVYSNRRMHDVTNYFIVNLALADILVCLLCLPITLLSNLYSGWNYGAFMCKASPFLQGVSVSASVNTLVAIAVDRYLAICHGLTFHLSSTAARSIICAIWGFAVLLMSPWAVYYEQRVSPSNFTGTAELICAQYWPSKRLEAGYFLGAIFLTCYTVPLVCISVCYTLLARKVCNRQGAGVHASASLNVVYKSKMKVLKMLVVVVVMFALSWLPLYAFYLWFYYVNPDDTFKGRGQLFQWLVQVIIPLIQWSGSSNSCVNPIIYCFFSRKFREGFLELVHCRCARMGGAGGSKPPSVRYVYRFNCSERSERRADRLWGGDPPVTSHEEIRCRKMNFAENTQLASIDGKLMESRESYH